MLFWCPEIFDPSALLEELAKWVFGLDPKRPVTRRPHPPPDDFDGHFTGGGLMLRYLGGAR